MSNRKENPSRDLDSHDEIVKLVSAAKHRPLPRSTKALAVFVIVGLIFTGGIAYGKHRATASTSAGLSLSALSGGGIGAGFGGGGFGGGRNRGGTSGASGTAGTLSGGAVSGGTGGFGTGAAAAASTDVAGTIVSITSTSVVIQTLSGDKQTFPLLTNTRVRQSTQASLATVKPGDIVTIKPDATNAAKTITVVK